MMKGEFDVREFLLNLKATKPPYECPYDHCGKLYKSYTGMKFHLFQVDHRRKSLAEDGDDRNDKRKGRWHHRTNMDRSPSPPDFLRGCTRESLTYAEAQKMVEFDVDGRVYRININEPLNIVYVDGKNGDLPTSNGDVVKRGSEVSNLGSSNAKGKTAKGRASKGKGSKGKLGKNKKEAQPPTEDKNHSTLVAKLPEPSFRVIEDYQSVVVPERSNAYYRYIEKSPEEIEEEVEYDMDEEDTAWLDLVNKKRRNDGLPEVPADIFEILMDRLEKESYFQSQNSGKEMGPAIDEDAVCCICNDGECQNSNAILFCDMCNLAVHQECYGVPYIPEGQWLCRRCLQSPSRAVDCVLCPNKGGAFKQTDDNQWAHVVCALWIPEVCFANTVFLEPIDSICNIPSARWKLTCYICKQRGVGACIQCHKANCYVAFHVTCAQQAGLYMKMEAVKEVTTSGVITNVRKAAFCDAHTPPDENGTSLSGVYSSSEEDSRTETKRMQQTKAKFKEKMKKARKILAEKRSAIPVVSVPTIPLERLTKIALLINIPKRNQFVQLLLGYWTLKRQSRNGVPLLRRLQISHAGMRRGDGNKDADDEQIVQLKEQLKSLQRLRQDLEKARLLVELIRKREKLKKEMIKHLQVTIEMQMNPYRKFLENVLNKLEEKDSQRIFAEPVNIDEVPDYLSFIKQPMDFSTMRHKIKSNQYRNFQAFEDDLELIVNNCTLYNDKETFYYKAAVKLRDHATLLFKEARRVLVDFNEKTGLFAVPTQFDIQISPIKTPVTNERVELEGKLKNLKEELTKANQTKSGGSRTKRVRSLTAEIADLQGQIKSMKDDQFLNVKKVNSTNNLNKPKKLKKKKKLKNKNTNSHDHVVSSISSIENTILFVATEGRRTLNSVASTIDIDEIGTLNNNNSPNLSPNNKTESVSIQKESPKRKRKRSISSNRQLKAKNNIIKTDDTKTNRRPVQPRKRVNGTSTSQISPDSNSTRSPVSHNLNHLENNDVTSKPNRTLKSTNRKKNTVDASTCTPPNMFTLTAENFAKQQAAKGTKRRSNRTAGNKNKKLKTLSAPKLQLDNPIPFSPASIPQTDSFRVYRNLNSPAESEANSTHSSESTASSSISTGSSGSSHSSLSSSVLSASSSRSGELVNTRKSQRPRSRASPSTVSINHQNIPLQHLDLVWAKCRGFPWYPALIINPDQNSKMEKNGIIIPVPPEDVLSICNHTDNSPQYLVSFFDTKRSWQWLTRDKLEPLGVDPMTDQIKLGEPKKQNERKAVKIAYEKAILFVVNDKTNHLDESTNGI